MDKNNYEEAVFKSGMSGEAKLVLLAYLHHCKQQDLKEVWPSQSRVADYAGLTRDTVKTYVSLLVESGWLIEGKKHEGNVQGYTFAVADTFDNRLAKKKRKSAQASLEQLRRGSATDPRSVAERMRAVAESKTEQLPNGSSTVAETGSAGKEKEKNNLEKKEKPARSAPRLPDDPNLPLASSSTEVVDLSSSNPPLASSTEAVAPPIGEEEEIEVIWDIDGEETPEGSENNEPARETHDAPAPVAEAPRPVPGHARIVEAVAVNAEHKGWTEALAEAVVEKCVELKVKGDRRETYALVSLAYSKVTKEDDESW